jgi:hypothetical protein
VFFPRKKNVFNDHTSSSDSAVTMFTKLTAGLSIYIVTGKEIHLLVSFSRTSFIISDISVFLKFECLYWGEKWFAVIYKK